MHVSEFAARPGTLYIVATPIGNLRDITLRALDILKSVDLIAAEDTRTAAGLLAAHGIDGHLVSCHEHNEVRAAQTLIGHLQAGRSVALISDAGTPGISDPGAVLVRAARDAGLALEPIPGPSAVTTALSVAGLSGGEWRFHGFLPAKPAARRKLLERHRTLTGHGVYYEAPHRVTETLADLAALFGPERPLFIARELTKRFETLHACLLGEAQAWLAADPNNLRGEFVLIVGGAREETAPAQADAERVLAVLLDELPASQAARLAARITGAKRNVLYHLVLGRCKSTEG